MSPGNGLTVAELAERIGGRVSGDGEILIDHVATLRDATKGAIAFVDHPKFLDDARRSEASCVIVPQGTRLDSTCTIEVASPKLAFALVAELLHPPVRREPHVDPTAVISRTADVALTAFIGANVTVGDRSQIGARTEILAGAAIGANVQIGVDCVIHPNAVLYDGVQLGDRVVLHAGVVVGADGFGYVPDESNMRHKFPQIGTVVIEDDVEIGANTCIDRGALGETRIGRATKIDNLVQVGHNVRIGARVVIAAQTGISGSVVIEDDVIVGGQVGFGEHVTIKKGAVIAAKSAIFPGKVIREGAVVWGIPARPLNEFKRLNAHFGKLPELREKIGALAARVEELAKRIAGQKGDD